MCSVSFEIQYSENYGVYGNTYFCDYFHYCEERCIFQAILVGKPGLSFLLGSQINGISLTWPQGGGTVTLNLQSEI